jgi:hypothetical protein
VGELRATTLVTAFLILVIGVGAYDKAPLGLMQTIPLPGFD